MSDVRLTLVGPMPPPVNGQSVVMGHMTRVLGQHFTRMRVADTGDGGASGRLLPVVKVWRSLAAWRCVPGSDAVYLAVKADHGMWLTTATAVLARLVGARVFLHHHSYAYVRERKLRMVALTRAAGPRARHIVLAASMADDLTVAMPEIGAPLVVGNAGLVNTTLLEAPLRTDGGELVLGHLSNLSLAKGIAEVIDLAVALRDGGTATRLIVAGPAVDGEARAHLDRADRELGDAFDYRGPLRGDRKHQFFSEITHFVFPTRYVHEAVPLVLYEAMAAGAVCVSTAQGAMAEQVRDSPGLLADGTESFVEQALPLLAGASASSVASAQSRLAYRRALADSERQLADLVTLLAGGRLQKIIDGK